MKLFTPQEAQQIQKRQHDELVGKNAQLLDWFHTGMRRYNKLKDNYDTEKVKAEKEFMDFVAQINAKKATLLKELTDIQELIKQKHDTIDALMLRQDELDEREYTLARRKMTLDDRESFIKDIESKHTLI